jgi:hypothetical protein
VLEQYLTLEVEVEAAQENLIHSLALAVVE